MPSTQTWKKALAYLESYGNRHDHHDLSLILAGRAGGEIPGEHHIRFEEKTPLSNLFLGVSASMGAKIDSFGDSSKLISMNDLHRS